MVNILYERAYLYHKIITVCSKQITLFIVERGCIIRHMKFLTGMPTDQLHSMEERNYCTNRVFDCFNKLGRLASINKYTKKELVILRHFKIYP